MVLWRAERAAGSVITQLVVGWRKVPNLRSNVRPLSNMCKASKVSATYLHYGLAASTCHDHRLLLLEHYSPHCLRRLAEFAYESSLPQIPNLDATITTAGYDPSVVKLKACDAVIMCCQAVDGLVFIKRPHAHGSVGATGYKDITAHLQLADERSVTLKQSQATSDHICQQSVFVQHTMMNLPIVRVPNPDASVKTASCYPLTIEGNGVYLAKMARERP